MVFEWDVHNRINDFHSHERLQDVDLDNADENTTELGFWSRAVWEGLKGGLR